jgi:outer membrane protein
MRARLLTPVLFGLLALGSLGASPVWAQTPPTLTLADATARALANHPRVLGAEAIASAASAVKTETQSARYPTIFGSLTAVDALSNSRIAAGGLNNPIIYDRYSNGVTVSQLVTDFGRTGNLIASATLRQEARKDDVAATRADIALQVAAAYLDTLRAQAVLQVADDTVRARQLVVNQITALAQNQLKSQLDVSFANVDLSQAQLLQLQARNDVEARFADLAAAMGERDTTTYTLVDPAEAGPVPTPVPAVDPLISAALAARPDLLSARADFHAAATFVSAQADLWRPAVSFAAAAGLTPFRQDTLTDRYGAAGINVTIPIFNGHLFGAERAEAQAHADAESQRVRDEEDRIVHDVRVAWLQAGAAFQRIALTGQLVAEATQAQSLAQSRYDLGLSSIVELSQAQLNATEARLAEANARYGYAAALALLRYQAGQTP